MSISVVFISSFFILAPTFYFGCVIIQGFDEYMNLTLDDAEELDLKKKTRKQLGRILLKGDNITSVMKVSN